MDENIVIKELSTDDMDCLLELRMEVLSHVFSEEKESISNHEWEKIRKENENYYSEELETRGHIACAIYVDQKLAGCGGVCLYREMPSPDNSSGNCAYLMNIYVREAYRRKGLAKRLCEFLIQKAREFGAEKIYLESSDMAVNLYKNIGFTNMNGYMKFDAIK
ncbi:MAG: GNAT family N-acetyltransferase [Lachnospiraceae bacterium]|nr:GNAT family N-acetyltransferase [Lachnospiraceae bacterium]